MIVIHCIYIAYCCSACQRCLINSYNLCFVVWVAPCTEYFSILLLFNCTNMMLLPVTRHDLMFFLLLWLSSWLPIVSCWVSFRVKLNLLITDFKTSRQGIAVQHSSAGKHEHIGGEKRNVSVCLLLDFYLTMCNVFFVLFFLIISHSSLRQVSPCEYLIKTELRRQIAPEMGSYSHHCCSAKE